MKKVLLLLAICVALVALLASCGSEDKVTTTAAKTTTQAPTVQTTVAKTEIVETTEAPSTKAPTTNEFGQSSTDLLEPDYVENGFTYDIYKDGAILLTAPTDAAELTVPASIKDGKVAVKSIASFAFQNNEMLKKVTLEDGITVLGSDVFYGCFNLTEIKLPATLTQLGNGVFRNCYLLDNVTIPNTVTSMGTDVFFECRSLKTVVLPDNDSFVILPNQTFYNCTSLEEVTLPAATTIIGEKAFYYCTSLKNFTFTDKISALGVKAFYYCTSLSAIDLSASQVASIPNYAFFKCSAATTIKMSDITKSIGAYAFYGCESIDAITIPETVSSISTGAFAYCTKVTALSVPNAVKTLADRAFYNCKALKSIAFANDVTAIGTGTFAYSALESFTLAPTVTSIGDSAFAYCSSLKEFKFEDGCTLDNISKLAFAYSGLKAIHLPESVTVINIDAFRDCTALEEVSFSPYTTQIGLRAFVNCTAVKEFIIPDTVTNIGKNAIAVSLVNNVAVPNENTVVYAFEGGNVANLLASNKIAFKNLGVSGFVPYKDLVIRVVEGTTDKYELVKYLGNLETIAIHEKYTGTLVDKDGNLVVDKDNNAVTVDGVTITKIAANFMKDNAAVTSITLPASVTEIGESAFENCTALASVKFPDKLTEIKAKAFMNTALTALDVSKAAETFTKIGESAFEGCAALSSVTFGSKSILSEIQKRAFALSSVTNITLPSSVSVLGDEAFAGCGKLLYINLNGGAPKTVGADILKDTTPLTAFHFKDAHKDSYEIKEETVGTDEKVTTWLTYPITSKESSDAFKTWVLKESETAESFVTVELYYNGKLNIKATLATGVKTTPIPDFASAEETPWFAYKQYIDTINFADKNISKIGNYTFAGLSNVTLCSLPSAGLTEIGEYTFKDTTSLSTVALNTVNTIGKGAFSGSGITSLVLPTNLTTISDELFLDCANLTEVTGGAKVTAIGARAFKNTLLAKLSIDKVTTIGDEAFMNCTALTAITTGATKVGASAFEGCSALTDVIQGNVTEIGNAAFKGTLVSNFTFTALKTIGDNAFADCSALNEITLKNSFPTVGTGVFDNTPPFAHFFLTGGESKIKDGKWNGYKATSSTSDIADTFVVDNGKVTVSITYKGNMTITAKDGGVIPNYTSADEVPWNGYKNYVTKIEFNNVAAIGDYAFAGFTNTQLTTLTFTSATKSIGAHAFEGCNSITTVTSYADSIGEMAFASCEKLATANLNTVSSFGYKAFGDCIALKNVSILGSVGPVSASASNAFENTPYNTL